ncbi:MAG: hypothetical protein AAFQ15_13625, partial [Pseudomonadota bacterium]
MKSEARHLRACFLFRARPFVAGHLTALRVASALRWDVFAEHGCFDVFDLVAKHPPVRVPENENGSHDPDGDKAKAPKP